MCTLVHITRGPGDLVLVRYDILWLLPPWCRRFGWSDISGTSDRKKKACERCFNVQLPAAVFHLLLYPLGCFQPYLIKSLGSFWASAIMRTRLVLLSGSEEYSGPHRISCTYFGVAFFLIACHRSILLSLQWMHTKMVTRK